jgi:hypothetical protein
MEKLRDPAFRHMRHNLETDEIKSIDRQSNVPLCGLGYGRVSYMSRETEDAEHV